MRFALDKIIFANFDDSRFRNSNFKLNKFFLVPLLNIKSGLPRPKFITLFVEIIYLF